MKARLVHLIRRLLGLPFECPACGERTRHGHWVAGWKYAPGYWSCPRFLRRLGA